MTTQCVIYACVSTDRQELDRTSLVTQEARYCEFAQAKGWTVVSRMSPTVSGDASLGTSTSNERIARVIPT